MAGTKTKPANGRIKDTKKADAKRDKRAKGLADLQQLENAVAELVRPTSHPQPGIQAHRIDH